MLLISTPGAGGSLWCSSSLVSEGARVCAGEGAVILFLSSGGPGGEGSHRGRTSLGGGSHDRGQDRGGWSLGSVGVMNWWGDYKFV